MLNSFTGLFFQGSCTLNRSRTFSWGFGGQGVTLRSRWYSTGSGIPATSFIPHRAQLPGPLDRTSLSMGQIHTRSLDGSGGAGTCAKKIPAERRARTRINARMTTSRTPGSDVGYYKATRDHEPPHSDC